MGLRLHNTLTRTKEDFVPIDPQNVRMYVCGPTVYDFAHIGNARPLIVFDVLFRLLRHIYGEKHVTYVRNITDVDDKINARAAEEGISIRELTERTTRQFHEDVAALGCLPPTYEPRATDYVTKPDAPEDMIRLTQKLIERGNAYTAEGHVLFHVASMPDYGKLSNRSLDEMIAGARVEVAPYKKDPMDFVLWKPSKPGEPSWPSPWGAGRPGWHLECSAMAGALLGETFDIHGGGIDLVFPHHENEIAQSRCAHGTDVMANYWLHNGFLQVEGEKMSKSLGNFVTVRELLDSDWAGGPWSGGVLRLAMLSTHYRQPIDWTRELVESTRAELYRWAETLLNYGGYRGLAKDNLFLIESVDTISLPESVVDALSDDLNTPQVLAVLRALHAKAKGGHKESLLDLLSALHALGVLTPRNIGVLAGRVAGDGVGEAGEGRLKRARVFQTLVSNGQVVEANTIFRELHQEGVSIELDSDGVVWLSAGGGGAEHLDSLIAARAAARARKDFDEADRIRDELDAMGIALKDSKDPKTGELVTTWEVKR